MNQTGFSHDVLDLLSLLHEEAVRYLIVGGEAVIHYGYARLTGDIDLYYEPAPENAGRLFSALKAFWGGSVPEVNGAEELLQPGLVLQFGVPPNRIDLLNRIDGVGFPECWDRRASIEVSVGPMAFPVHFIGLAQLIRNKESSGRDKDKDDLRFLRRIRPEGE